MSRLAVIIFQLVIEDSCFFHTLTRKYLYFSGFDQGIRLLIDALDVDFDSKQEVFNLQEYDCWMCNQNYNLHAGGFILKSILIMTTSSTKDHMSEIQKTFTCLAAYLIRRLPWLLNQRLPYFCDFRPSQSAPFLRLTQFLSVQIKKINVNFFSLEIAPLRKQLSRTLNLLDLAIRPQVSLLSRLIDKLTAAWQNQSLRKGSLKWIIVGIDNDQSQRANLCQHGAFSRACYNDLISLAVLPLWCNLHS